MLHRVGDGSWLLFFFFFNDTATTEIYSLSLHDALPISRPAARMTLLCRSLWSTRNWPARDSTTATATSTDGVPSASRPGSGRVRSTARGSPTAGISAVATACRAAPSPWGPSAGSPWGRPVRANDRRLGVALGPRSAWHWTARGRPRDRLPAPPPHDESRRRCRPRPRTRRWLPDAAHGNAPGGFVGARPEGDQRTACACGIRACARQLA